MSNVNVDMSSLLITMQPGARFQAVYEAVSVLTDIYIPGV